jgi:hypothetical protein
MADANVRIPEEARDRLAELAAAEGLSLRGYLARLAAKTLTPAERAQRVEQTKTMLHEWNGYNPTPEQEAAADADLLRQVGRAA